jgi:hypothetical protein
MAAVSRGEIDPVTLVRFFVTLLCGLVLGYFIGLGSALAPSITVRACGRLGVYFLELTCACTALDGRGSGRQG